MNWGYKILAVYIVFILGILFMVYRSASQNTDLVTTDYYAKELKYQEKIDEAGRVAALSAPVTCDIRNNELVIVFPKDFNGRQLTGELELYCPSDKNKDVKKDFTITDQALIMAVPPVNKGLHELHLSWKDGAVTYYLEKKIFL
jgi:hypothetical protein